MNQLVNATQKPVNLKVLCVVGALGCGKTSLIKVIHDPGTTMDMGYRPTVHSSFYLSNFKIQGKDYSIQWWDSSGKEIFMQFIIPIFKLCDCLVLVYDTTNMASFKKVEQLRRRYIKAAGLGHPPAMVLVGTKLDLSNPENPPAVTPDMAHNYALQANIHYEVQVSALNGDNLKEFLQYCMDGAFKQKQVFMQMKSTVFLYKNQEELIETGRIMSIRQVNYEATWLEELWAKCLIM